MKPLTLNPPFASVFVEEISAVSGYYNLPEHHLLDTLKPVAGCFEKYWEMVFAAESFELITAGTGTAFARKVQPVALQQGLSDRTVKLFASCQAAFPEAVCGLKLVFSAHGNQEPTLYVRTKTGVAEVLEFLSKSLNSSEIQLLKQALRQNKVLYGLGFSEKQGELYLKTYTINPVKAGEGTEIEGFVSHRLHRQQISQEHKTYLPEVSLYKFAPEDPQLKALQQFLVHRMNYTTAGHIGMLYQQGKQTETKIYVERVGGIPTDFSAR